MTNVEELVENIISKSKPSIIFYQKSALTHSDKKIKILNLDSGKTSNAKVNDNKNYIQFLEHDDKLYGISKKSLLLTRLNYIDRIVNNSWNGSSIVDVIEDATISTGDYLKFCLLNNEFIVAKAKYDEFFSKPSVVISKVIGCAILDRCGSDYDNVHITEKNVYFIKNDYIRKKSIGSKDTTKYDLKGIDGVISSVVEEPNLVCAKGRFLVDMENTKIIATAPSPIKEIVYGNDRIYCSLADGIYDSKNRKIIHKNPYGIKCMMYTENKKLIDKLVK